MKLNLWEILEGEKELLEFQGELLWEGFNLNGRKIDITEPIKYKGQVFNVDNDKMINIDIYYVFEEECNRCLNPTVNKINTILSGKLVEGKKDDEYKEIKDEEFRNEDDSYENILYYKNNNLNLKEYIIEQIILSLPMKIICKEDCKGLCLKCGINLNNSQCDCVYEDIDPRLEKLKDFFPKK
ncbi:MAG TPA: DUF177 domain-containing protein [Tissierellaceae bacterium]|nr:DUF177 domain-containing protein [Tissierellaceae bacterium]